MYLIIVLLLLLALIASVFFGRKLGVSGSQLITCSSVIATTVLAIMLFPSLCIYFSIFLVMVSESGLEIDGWFHFLGQTDIYDIEYVYIDHTVLFAEQGQDFMDLDSSGGRNTEGGNVIDNNVKENLKPAKATSDKLPQTEFEKKPYLDNRPLPKSASDPNTLGKDK